MVVVEIWWEGASLAGSDALPLYVWALATEHSCRVMTQDVGGVPQQRQVPGRYNCLKPTNKPPNQGMDVSTKRGTSLKKFKSQRLLVVLR